MAKTKSSVRSNRARRSAVSCTIPSIVSKTSRRVAHRRFHLASLTCLLFCLRLISSARSNINLSPSGNSSISGERGNIGRCKILFDLIQPLAQYLPCDVDLHLSDHDTGNGYLGEDQRIAALEAVEAGRFLEETELAAYEKKDGRVQAKGLVSACPEDSPAWQMAIAKIEGNETAQPKQGDCCCDMLCEDSLRLYCRDHFHLRPSTWLRLLFRPFTTPAAWTILL